MLETPTRKKMLTPAPARGGSAETRFGKTDLLLLLMTLFWGSNVTPVVAMIVAWFALGERVTPVQIIGAIITFIGLYLVRSGMITVAPAPEIEEEDSRSSLAPGKN